MERLNTEEIENRLQKLQGWELVDGALEASFQFENFKEAFSVMTRIAFECEAQNHHPDWHNVYNSLTIRLNTHDVNGITNNDFALAEIIEKLIV
ncbi:4a-hydroxytetrahydrobiopterin dehydratase [Spongiimicrobium sp. 3-5]|uniref:4a-hydroxytetrahydrobiopterin dehydratase n=1 Tax=Spongiimicrobium sp. 3-5 TaxID=3332596 RepID=UPI00397EB27A